MYGKSNWMLKKDFHELSISFLKQVSQILVASAGRHQTYLPSWRKESSVRVYAKYVSSEILWGSKDKNFLGHFWLGIFIQNNLPVNFKQEV